VALDSVLPIGTRVKSDGMGRLATDRTLVEDEEADMAYRASVRDDIEPDVLSAVEIEPFRPRSVAPAEFTALEEQVMAFARTDRLGSIETPGRIERLFTRLFGLNVEQRALADPRLEALRRGFVVARHRHHLPDVQAGELREAGFSIGQIRVIELRAIAV
jgi:hypothetical protein